MNTILDKLIILVLTGISTIVLWGVTVIIWGQESILPILIMLIWISVACFVIYIALSASLMILSAIFQSCFNRKQ